MSEEEITRRFCFENFFESCKPKMELISTIEQFVVSTRNLSESDKKRIKSFVYDLSRYWNNCNRTRDRFEKKYSNWLSKPLFIKNSMPKKRTASNARLQKEFEDLSISQKRRRTTDLRRTDCNALLFAASSKLREEGNASKSKILQRVLKSPENTEKAVDAYAKQQTQLKKMSIEKALAISLDCSLTRRQYQHLRNNSKDQATNQFPSYNDVLTAKKACYPKNVRTSEIEAVVPLQSLLNHTSSRFIACLDLKPSIERLKIFYKWGFDGSSGHAQYKMLFKESSEKTDFSVLITTIVPLKIIDLDSGSVIWENTFPSSTRYCRPIRIAFEKETSDSIRKEYERMIAEIQNLTASRLSSENQEVHIDHQLFLTMLDGKSINVIENNVASSRCYICNAGPSQLNDLYLVNITERNPSVEEKLKYGISPLHARIKSFEFLLNLSYRLTLPKEAQKKGSRLTAEQKTIIKERKSQIQEEFRSKLGLIVDTPKQGFGSSNDGNTARTFFKKSDISAQILGIEKELVDRFATIVSAINVSEELDAGKYGDFALETAKLLLEKYSFWTMTPTIHKMLLHGKDIISNSLLPIGSLSEEALEHRNKDLKNFRSNYARKISREENLIDIFNRFFMTSDPLITNLRASTKSKNKRNDLSLAVKKLLKTPQEEESDVEDIESDDELI